MRVVDTMRLLTTYPLNSTYALLGIQHRPSSTLARWDRLLASRDTPMIAGADAHGFPSYARLFTVARNHLVLERPRSGDARTDTAAIVDGASPWARVCGDRRPGADSRVFVCGRGRRQRVDHGRHFGPWNPQPESLRAEACCPSAQ